MNPIQKQWLGLGVAVMLIMLICPPWTKTTRQVVRGMDKNGSLMQTESQDFAGYSPIFDPPPTRQLVQGGAPGYQAFPGDLHESVKIDFERLLLQWLTAAFLTGAGLLYFKDSDKKSLGESGAPLQALPKPLPPPTPPVSGSFTPPFISESETKQRTPPKESSPWRRARKPADKAFGWAFVITVASFYFGYRGGETTLPVIGRILAAGCFGVILGLGCFAVTYVVAGLYYAAKGGPGEADLPVDSKPEKQRGKLVGVGILVVVGLFAASKPGRDAMSYLFWEPGRDERNPTNQPTASPAGEATEPGAKAQAAAEFEKEFYQKYPDLNHYRAVVDAVTSRLVASGFTAETREAVMEEFAKRAREELLRQQQALSAPVSGTGQTGREKVKDPIEELRSSAERGFPGSQFELGWSYEKGNGLEQDSAKAAYWYRKAAEQDHLSAQNNLGVLYQAGRGVPHDDAEAVAWYLRAAKSGNATAQNNLGLMYQAGRGVRQDAVEAFGMFCVAAKRGNPEAVTNRDGLAKSLTADQVADGYRHANSFLSRKSGLWELEPFTTDR
jgi:TPR repeat protein